MRKHVFGMWSIWSHLIFRKIKQNHCQFNSELSSYIKKSLFNLFRSPHRISGLLWRHKCDPKMVGIWNQASSQRNWSQIRWNLDRYFLHLFIYRKYKTNFRYERAEQFRLALFYPTKSKFLGTNQDNPWYYGNPGKMLIFSL